MKIIIAPDSFKDSIPSKLASQIIADTILSKLPDCEIHQMPMADGGEGTADTVMAAKKGEWIPVRTSGPLLDMVVDSGFAWFPKEEMALVEMAASSGIELLSYEQRNPLNTTTLGTGELIASAIDHGAKKILLAVGSSATIDLGVGMATALGWKFLDDRGNEIRPIGQELRYVHDIIAPDHKIEIQIEVLCDVENPLLGSKGAAPIFGPQKGATPDMVLLLEQGLENVAILIYERLGVDIRTLKGGGAAGGIAAGAVAFFNAQIVSGVETILHLYHLDEILPTADWIITGEGRFDATSLDGKVVSGILNISKKYQTNVAVFAGQVKVEADQFKEIGIASALAISPEDLPLPEALKRGPELLESAVQKWMNEKL